MHKGRLGYLKMMISGLLMSEEVNNKILTKHKEAMQNYMMTGYESKWQHCDSYLIKATTLIMSHKSQ